MFHLSRKNAIIKVSIFGTIIAIAIIASICFIKHVLIADAITPSGTPVYVYDPTGEIIYYDDDNHTQEYRVKDESGNWHDSFCAEPSEDYPGGEWTKAYQLSDNSEANKKMKLIIFLYQNNNARTRAARNAIFSVWSSSEHYAWTHAVIGALYAHDYTNISAGNVANINHAISVLGDLISSNDDVWIMAKNYQLYYAPGYAPGVQDVVWLENNYKYGSLEINKCDNGTNTCTPQGDASFSGITFDVYNNSGTRIYNPKKDTFYDAGALVDSGVTNANGVITFSDLLANDINYRIVERSTNASYQLTAPEQTSTLNTNNQKNSLNFYNAPVTGQITVNKVDAETKSCAVRARAHSFAGTTLQIINKSNAIIYNGATIAKDGVVTTKTLAENECSFTIEGLPYGTYQIKETAAAAGYALSSDPVTVTIPTNNSVNVTATFENEPIRGDLTFVKKDATNDTPMSNTLFSISALDEDSNVLETHLVVSNASGVVDTRSSFAPHSFHTNGYDAIYDDLDSENSSIPYLGYGVWFGFDTEGNRLPVNDNIGALPYGKYLIQEMRCNANHFCYNLKDEKVVINVTTSHQVIDLGDWNNTCALFSLETKAVDSEDEDQYVEAKSDAKIIDHVSYCARKNKKFTIKGILMDKEAGEPLLIDGKTVESSTEFTPEEECGELDLEFNLNGTNLGGKKLVVFESLYYEGELIKTHEDLDDEDQTVEMGFIGTYATDAATGKKTLPLDQDVEIKDVVKYCLTPGLEYTIRGILMDKETSSALLINDQPVESEITFTPEETCGEVEMLYKVNTTNLAGKRLVVFESLYRDDELLIEHKDFNNADESIEVEIPVPDTGMLTKNDEGSSSNGIFIASIGITVVSLGAYAAVRHYTKKKALRF